MGREDAKDSMNVEAKEMSILGFKAMAFDVISDLIGNVWEYCNAEVSDGATGTLFEINGAVTLANEAVKLLIGEGADDGKKE